MRPFPIRNMAVMNNVVVRSAPLVMVFAQNISDANDLSCFIESKVLVRRQRHFLPGRLMVLQ